MSREALILMDLFDLDHMVAAGGKQVKPHSGRPWTDVDRSRHGNADGRSPEEVKELLRAAARGEL